MGRYLLGLQPPEVEMGLDAKGGAPLLVGEVAHQPRVLEGQRGQRRKEVPHVRLGVEAVRSKNDVKTPRPGSCCSDDSRRAVPRQLRGDHGDSAEGLQVRRDVLPEVGQDGTGGVGQRDAGRRAQPSGHDPAEPRPRAELENALPGDGLRRAQEKPGEKRGGRPQVHAKVEPVFLVRGLLVRAPVELDGQAPLFVLRPFEAERVHEDERGEKEQAESGTQETFFTA